MEFSWDRIGDIEKGRENLGQMMPVVVYRLMQYTLTDVLAQEFGEEKAEDCFRKAGFIAGESFARQLLDLTQDFNAFVAELQKVLREQLIGVLRMEKVDLEKMEMTLTIAEDLDCSGLPVLGDSVCVYDEGFIAGILYAYTGKRFEVVEIDCWATGDRVCRFTAKAE